MHLFTCQCGESFPISPPQAGQTVQCPHCREAISLPNLGELKQLPEAQLSRREASAGSWSSARGIVFSLICAGLLAMLTASAWSTYGWLSIPKPPTRDEMIAQGQEEIAEHTAPQLLDFWFNYGQPGMGTRRTPGYAAVQQYRDSWKRWAYVSYAGSALFLAALVFVIRRKPDARQAEAVE